MNQTSTRQFIRTAFTLLIFCAVTLNSQSALAADGTVNFNNYVPGQVDARWTMPDGTPLGKGWKAQLYGGAIGGTLSPLFPATTFQTSSDALRGYVHPVTVTMPGVSPGERANIEMRVYDGDTFETSEARAATAAMSVTVGGSVGGLELPPGVLSALIIPRPMGAPNPAPSRVLTVDNNPGNVAMFKTIQDAYDAALPGDTILLAGSPASYGGVTLKKRLNIVGPGYFLSENNVPGLSVHPANLDVGLGISAESSSAGSTFTGLMLEIGVDGNVPPNLLDRVGNILIDRCYIGSRNHVGHLEYGIHFQATIRRSILSRTGGGYFNISPGSSLRNSQLTGIFLGAGATVANCVIFGLPIAVELSSISSTIFYVAPATPEQMPSPAQFAESVKGSVTYCMAVAPLTGASFLPVGGGNVNGVASELVFTLTGSPDAKWQLRANSPAIGRGFGGVDMGSFGGPTPYILGGVPSLPRLTRLVVPAEVTSSSGLLFEVDAQSF